MASAAQSDLNHEHLNAYDAAKGRRFDGQGESMARRRYQTGWVFLRGSNPPKWIGRYREDIVGREGIVQRIRTSVVLGTKSELPTKRLAQRRLELTLARINAPEYRPGRVATVAEFAERWTTECFRNANPQPFGLLRRTFAAISCLNSGRLIWTN